MDPEQKRKIIGHEFIRVFEEEAKKIKGDYLLQGTIYPDVIESGSGQAAVIKSHHNVGGLPKDIGFKGLIEPLRMLFKDEVRALGEELGIPHRLVWRQPFPGPGLAVRILGEITEEKLTIVQESDAILREEIAKAGLDQSIWQYFTVFPDVRTVGVKGDSRSYDYLIAIRAVVSERRDDGGCGGIAVSAPKNHFQSHHQRSTGRWACRLRRDQQTAGNDRVGVVLGMARFPLIVM